MDDEEEDEENEEKGMQDFNKFEFKIGYFGNHDTKMLLK